MSSTWLITLLFLNAGVAGDRVSSEETAAERGYRYLRTHPYLPPDFDQQVFSELWKAWPEADRARAAEATPPEQAALIRRRYGLIDDPERPDGPGLGYVHTDSGWVMNCLSCHSGRVAGMTIPGAPNTTLALADLTADVSRTRQRLGRLPSHLESASRTMPLGTTNGTTNAVMFGVVLAAYRNKDMDVDLSRAVPPLAHHDMDAPPLWNVRRKRSLYADGFAPKNHRMLLQFMMLPTNSGATMRGWEKEYRDVLAWINSLEAPRYPWKIDEPLARRGRPIFEEHCAQCHGTYGPDGVYEQQTISIEEVGTDPVRLKALPLEHREWVRRSWMSHYGEDSVDLEPIGYVAPPLDGIWASAPYLHNGSVPTLWHLLHPDERPKAWQRSPAVNAYDRARVGLSLHATDSSKRPSDRDRSWFETSQPGKSAAGHLFPDALTENQKAAVLEYLKTL